MPDRFELSQLEAARHYRKRAVALRQQARVAVGNRLCEFLLENADLYEKLATWAEQRAQDGRKPLARGGQEPELRVGLSRRSSI